MTDPGGNTTGYGYDAAGRETTITDALGGRVTTAYDLAGQKTSTTNPRGDTTNFTYDSLGDLLTQTDPAGHVTSYAYDLAGRQTSKTDPCGVAVTNTYNAGNQLTGISFPGGSIGFVYDALGRRTSMTDPTGTTGYAYDGDSRLTSVAAPQGAVGYGYDAAGNRTSMSVPGRGLITYAYDAANQLSQLTDWASQSFSFTYTADGLPASINRPNGVVTNYSYDGADRLTSVHHDGPSGTVAHFDYTLDANGNRTSMTTAAGTEAYTLDTLNRLTGVKYANGDTGSYSYDAAGNRLTSTLNGATTNYSYDSAGRLVSAGANSLTYDASGNVLTNGLSSFSWDWAGRLATANVGGIASSYTYDGDGIRVASTIAGSTTNYVWDRAASLPLLIDDGTQGYVQTDQGLLEQLGSIASYPLGDALGSVRDLASQTASIVGTTAYDAFGSVRSQSGQQGTFGFTGQQTDITGFSFLRSRYYDPVLGRFVSPDSVQPNAPGTQGFNLYSYVANDATTAVDLSGETLTEELVKLTSTARTVVSGLALGAAIGRLLLAARIAFEVASTACRVYVNACLALGGLVTAFVGVELAKVAYAVASSYRPPSPVQQPPSPVQAPTPRTDPPPEPVVTIDDAVRQCLRSVDFRSLQRTGPADPCRFPPGFNLYYSGSDIPNTSLHILGAILLKDLPALLHRRPINPPRRPSDSRSNCTEITPSQWCDEYPFWSTAERIQVPEVSWAPVPDYEQSAVYRPSQASTLNSFYADCGVSKQGGSFVVIPQLFIPTFHICSDGRIGA